MLLFKYEYLTYLLLIHNAAIVSGRRAAAIRSVGIWVDYHILFIALPHIEAFSRELFRYELSGLRLNCQGARCMSLQKAFPHVKRSGKCILKRHWRVFNIQSHKVFFVQTEIEGGD